MPPPRPSHPPTSLAAPGLLPETSNASGQPSGTTSGVSHTFLSKRVGKASALLLAIDRFQDAHGAFTLLLSCAGWAKIFHFCSISKPSLQSASLAFPDVDVRGALRRLVRSPLSDGEVAPGQPWRGNPGNGGSLGPGTCARCIRRQSVPQRPSSPAYLACIR